MPKGCWAIGDYAFENCGSLEKLIIPAGMESIGDNAFKGCYNLELVILEDEDCLYWDDLPKDRNEEEFEQDELLN